MHSKNWKGYITHNRREMVRGTSPVGWSMSWRVCICATAEKLSGGTRNKKKDAVLDAVDMLEALKEYRAVGFDTRGILSSDWKQLVDSVGKEQWPFISSMEIEPPDKLLESVGMDMGSYYRYAASKYDLPVELFYKDTEYENL